MINTVDGFIRAFFEIEDKTFLGSLVGSSGPLIFGKLIPPPLYGNLYCPKCCGERRMNITLKHSSEGDAITPGIMTIRTSSNSDCIDEIKRTLTLSLWTYTCTQCDTLFTVIIYRGSNGVEMAILPSCDGGVVTANTPPSVAYYLDQANRAKSVGANSACIAMYRAALDNLMYEQGYTEGMLGAKIGNLQKDIDNRTAKRWAYDLDVKLLGCLKELGNGSIHPNDGNIEKQKEFDNELISLVDVVFGILLEKIYEQPKREENWRALLEDKAKSFSRTKEK